MMRRFARGWPVGRGLLRLLIEKETVSLPGEPDEVALILDQLEAQPPLERH